MLERAVDVDPSAPSHTVDYGPFILSQLARTHLTLRHYVVQIWARYPPDEAEKMLERAVDVNPSAAPALLNLGWIYQQRNKADGVCV